MEKRFGKGSEEFTMFTDYWQFVQKYYIPESQDDWWDELVKEADKLANKYGKSQYIRDLIMAHVNDCERRFKDAKAKVQ